MESLTLNLMQSQVNGIDFAIYAMGLPSRRFPRFNRLVTNQSTAATFQLSDGHGKALMKATAHSGGDQHWSQKNDTQPIHFLYSENPKAPGGGHRSESCGRQRPSRWFHCPLTANTKVQRGPVDVRPKAKSLISRRAGHLSGVCVCFANTVAVISIGARYRNLDIGATAAPLLLVPDSEII
jgi:hypothetical protein